MFTIERIHFVPSVLHPTVHSYIVSYRMLSLVHTYMYCLSMKHNACVLMYMYMYMYKEIPG